MSLVLETNANGQFYYTESVEKRIEENKIPNEDFCPVSSGYLDSVLHVGSLEWTANRVTELLQGVDFSALAFRGMSGALIAPSVALRMKKNLIMVRKPNVVVDPANRENTAHTSLRVEGALCRPQRYVIIDDFAATGHTLRVIKDTIDEKRGHRAYYNIPHELVGVVLYANVGRGTHRVQEIFPGIPIYTINQA